MLRFSFVGLLLALMLPTEPIAGVQGRSPGSRMGEVVPDDGGVPPAVLARRRAALLERLQPGIVILRSADPRSTREHPQDSDFRQDNDFYYLTGLETTGSWLVMFKAGTGGGKATLYVPRPDPAEEMWTGRRAGSAEEVAALTGVETVRPASEFETEVLGPMGLPSAFREFPHIYLSAAYGANGSEDLVKRALESHHSVADLRRPLAGLRLVKDSVEVARLRRAVDITAEAQKAAMRSARPGVYEYELEAIVEYRFRSRGAERVGFPTIVGSGPNSTVLHYDRNRRRTQEGDLVVIDAGAEFGYYTADITRTFPVSGEFTERQRAIYELVLATQRAVIEAVRPGATILELQVTARRYLRQHSNGTCGEASCDRFFVHGVSHWLGMDVHDVGDYSTPLEPGMVLTVEPGIYLPEEAIGVRIEDDILVTADGHEVLSEGAPRTVEEIEALMSEARTPCECRP